VELYAYIHSCSQSVTLTLKSFGLIQTVLLSLRVLLLLVSITVSLYLMCMVSIAGFPSRRPGFDPRSCHMGFYGGQSGSEAYFLGVLQFLLTIFIPQTLQYSLITLSSTIYTPDNDSVVKHPTKKKSNTLSSRFCCRIFLSHPLRMS
jgi:hypothetical protein